MQDNPKAINSKAELAVVLQDLDKEQEAAQLLKQILREPHRHDPGIDFVKDRARSSGPAAVEDCGAFPLGFLVQRFAIYCGRSQSVPC